MENYASILEFLESGESLIKSDELENHLWKVFEREKLVEEFEILLFWGKLDDFEERMKKINYQAMLNREQAVVDNLPLEFREIKGKVLRIR